MNLIEQLGGYEQLKGYIDGALRGMPDSYCYKFDTVLGLEKLLNMRDVKCILLEYRRQHNIYDVGDLIMYENKLYEIKYIYHTEKARITDGLQGRTVYDFPHGIRHATDAEIEAGRRL